MTVCHIEQLHLSYDGLELLSDINLSILAGQWVVMLGRSGCGKSTLLKAIAGLDHGAKQQGNIHCHGNIAYLSQQDSLLPWLSVCNNVQLADHLHGKKNADTQQRAYQLLEKVGLADHADKPPYRLSGGQRQRVALARTLMQDADLILMDEPFSAVDAITRLELQRLSAELLTDKAVILITHDPVEAIRLADVIYVMHNKELSKPYAPDSTRPRLDPQQSQPELQQQLLAALS